MPTHECLGPDDREDLQDRRKPAIKQNKEPAIIVRKPDATMEPAPHDIQLMSKHRVLGFKPQLRLEWRGQHGQNETEQPDHSANLGDSITASTRIRFSVHSEIGRLWRLAITFRRPTMDCVAHPAGAQPWNSPWCPSSSRTPPTSSSASRISSRPWKTSTRRWWARFRASCVYRKLKHGRS